MTTDSIKSIVHSAARFCSGTFLSRISGFLRDLSMAYYFGVASEVGVFFVAYRLSYLFRRLFSDGAMQSAFIPLFEQKKKLEGELAALNFYETLKRAMTVILTLFITSFIGLLFVTSSFLGEEYGELITLTIWMLPSLLFLSLYGINAAQMQCEKRYFLPASAPVLFNMVWVFGAYYFSDYPQKEAMRALAVVMNLGCFSQWLITLPYTNRRGKGTFNIFNSDIKALVKKMSLGFTGVAAIQVNNAIDPIFALSAEAGGPNFLWYAIRVKQIPLALFAIAISSALLPPLARAIQDGDNRRFKKFFHEVISKSSYLMIPLTFFICLAATPLIDTIFGYGEFDQTAVAKTAAVLVCYILGLAPATFILIQAQVFFALNDFKTPAYGALLSMISNAVLNTLLIYGLGFGAASVALATSTSSLINAIYLYRQLPIEKPSMAIPLIKATFCSAISAFTTITVAANLELPPNSYFQLAFLGTLFFTTYSLVFFLISRIGVRKTDAEDLAAIQSEEAI